MKKLNSVYDIHEIHEKNGKNGHNKVFFSLHVKTYNVVFISKK